MYGLTERNSNALRGARLVTNPGCYPTAALLALEPLAEAGLLAGEVVIDAKSGISGAGKKPSDRTHFSENHGSVAAYGVFGHRHTPEIERELGMPVTFVPHLVPLDRGILETIYAKVKPGTTSARVAELMNAAYKDAPFVRITGKRCQRSNTWRTRTSATSAGVWTPPAAGSCSCRSSTISSRGPPGRRFRT